MKSEAPIPALVSDLRNLMVDRGRVSSEPYYTMLTSIADFPWPRCATLHLAPSRSGQQTSREPQRVRLPMVTPIACRFAGRLAWRWASSAVAPGPCTVRFHSGTCARSCVRRLTCRYERSKAQSGRRSNPQRSSGRYAGVPPWRKQHPGSPIRQRPTPVASHAHLSRALPWARFDAPCLPWVVDSGSPAGETCCRRLRIPSSVMNGIQGSATRR
ncbi:hypothetical protein K466DRAFT_385367 [Polyporus arcularius HHB13444]|uniref:Uncharacterized protein n=1 Tax=Polyporus arcularius HHB13444 TaxID=1314778 RepID=A0A5C3NVF0_9APHY|nr:hypothetical protein K466DRAFT_385367 [Polyporus arcularius HHB13444]